MKRYKIIKSNGKLKRFEVWENGKKKKELKREKGELPEKASWKGIKRAREWKRKGKKGKPPWAKGKSKVKENK